MICGFTSFSSSGIIEGEFFVGFSGFVSSVDSVGGELDSRVWGGASGAGLANSGFLTSGYCFGLDPLNAGTLAVLTGSTAYVSIISSF